MKRTPHVKPMTVDLTKPLDLSTVKANDGTCFGKLWDPRDKACGQCADSEVCCILKEQLVKKKAAAKEEEEGPYLDAAQMDRVLDKQITRAIKSFEDPTTDELIAWLMGPEGGNIKDRLTAIERIKRYKRSGKITITQGRITFN